MNEEYKKISEFLENLARKIWTQGDDYFATETKTGKWRVGYTNDYPMQHGNGEEMMLPQEFVKILMGDSFPNL